MNSRDGIPLPVKDTAQLRERSVADLVAPILPESPAREGSPACNCGVFWLFCRNLSGFDHCRISSTGTNARRLPEPAPRRADQWIDSATRFSAACGRRLAMSGSGMTTMTVVPLEFVTKSMSPPS